MRAIFRLFNLYPGEARSTSSFLLLGFLWSFGAFGAFTLSEGMFLQHVGTKGLPSGYILTACVLCVLSSVLLIALHKCSIVSLFMACLCVCALTLLALYFLLNHPTVPIWYFFKVVGWITPILLYICFWAFLDQYFDLQDAKRFFCLFNSVLYLGDACAGGVIAVFLQVIGIQWLIILCLSTFLACIPVVLHIARHRKPVPEEHLDGNPQRTSSSLKQVFKTALRSPFTLALMLLFFLMQLIVITTEYSYMESFEKRLPGHNLTQFLATLAAYVSLGNLFFGLFFYSRAVAKMGVNNIILIAPLFFLSIFTSWSLHEAFVLALLAFVARESMVYTFDDNNLQLLISGVPTRVKNHVRIAIDTFFEPIGMLAGAALLFSMPHITHEMGLALSLLALCCVLFLRTRYSKAIFSNLLSQTIDFGKKARDILSSLSKKEQKKIHAQLLEYIDNGDEEIKLLAFESLLKMDHKPACTLFETLSIKGKLKMIELLVPSKMAIEHFKEWAHTEVHPSVKSALHFFLASHHALDKKTVTADLYSSHLGLKGAAILALKTTSENLSQALLALKNLKKLLDSQDEHEICMGLRILGAEKRPENCADLLPFLRHPHLNVARTAASAIASTTCPHPEKLIPHLTTSDPLIRKSLLQALSEGMNAGLTSALILASAHFTLSERKSVQAMIVPFGAAVIEPLFDLLHHPTHPVRVRLLAGKILSKIAPAQLKTHLPTLLSQERHLDFIVHMSATSASLEECVVLTTALQCKNRKIRGAALESLEKLCDPALFTTCRPLLLTLTPETVS